jgi:hypothetical protein
MEQQQPARLGKGQIMPIAFLEFKKAATLQLVLRASSHCLKREPLMKQSKAVV